MAKKRWNKNEKERAKVYGGSEWVYCLSGDELKSERVKKYVDGIKGEMKGIRRIRLRIGRTWGGRWGVL